MAGLATFAAKHFHPTAMQQKLPATSYLSLLYEFIVIILHEIEEVVCIFIVIT